jgi:hypothetical protein
MNKETLKAMLFGFIVAVGFVVGVRLFCEFVAFLAGGVQ